MDWILPLIAGLGIGSLLKSVVDHLIARRSLVTNRMYQEKREAYMGLLDALHRAAVVPSNENSKNFALWQTRCDLFGSPGVSRCVQEIVDTNDNQAERRVAFERLIATMRADLSG